MRRPRRAPTTIRGSSSGRAAPGIALLLSTAEDGRLLVGNAVDHADPAVDVLLMHSASGDSDADRHWQVEPPTAQCMLLALGSPPGDTGADNMVVFVDGTAPVGASAHADARVLVVS